jgi:5-methylcytosine-specific restriction endonuclease McrA
MASEDTVDGGLGAKGGRRCSDALRFFSVNRGLAANAHLTWKRRGLVWLNDGVTRAPAHDSRPRGGSYMEHYSRSHLAPSTLEDSLATNYGLEDGATADLLADIAEFDRRKQYLSSGYSSMLAYCMGKLRRTRDEARRRIYAARTARRFPAIFSAVAGHRLHLSGICQLAGYLTPANADELLKAAEFKDRLEIEEILRQRFPISEVLALVTAIPERVPEASPAEPREVAASPVEQAVNSPAMPCVPGRMEVRPSVAPIASGRVEIRFSADKSMHDKLRRAQELLGHQVPSGDLAKVFELALEALIAKQEKRKFGATDRPRANFRSSRIRGRHISATIRRAVHERDGGSCTFTSADGHRCSSRERIEFDHIIPIALGGETSVGNLRLRCRAHNQHEADLAFGVAFMDSRRANGSKRTESS